MRHLSLVLVFAAAVGLLLTACSDNTAPPNPDPYAKKPPILDPPPGWDPFMADLGLAFGEVEWVDVQITIDRLATTGGKVSALPPGYPADRPITITYTGGDPAVVDGEPEQWTCTIAVPAAPPNGGYLDIPRGCLIYKYKDFPPPNSGDVLLGIPVAPWNNTESYTGTFNSYIMETDASGWFIRAHEELVTVPWPPANQDDVVYVTFHGDPGLEGGDRTGDGTIEPVEPGDETKRALPAGQR